MKKSNLFFNIEEEEQEEDIDYDLLDTLEDDNDFEIIKKTAREDDFQEYSWANFNYKILWGKTDRWDSTNYYPTEWEKFLKNG